MLLRLAYALSARDPAQTILDSLSLMNVATPMIATLLPVIGTTGFLLLCSDRIRRDWERAASTDYLTGLANRRTLAAAGELGLRTARAGNGRLAVAVIDIDHFKSINDRYGHDIGDLALQHVARCLASACASRDLPARQGGEEFVVLYHQLDPPQALAAAERARAAVAAQPFCAAEVTIPITVSIGVTSLRAEDHQFDDLLRRADQALYAAKAAGRNRVVSGPSEAP
jgi:diguanylate cyclase (GGDEF)-like protein